MNFITEETGNQLLIINIIEILAICISISLEFDKLMLKTDCLVLHKNVSFLTDESILEINKK